MSFRTQRRVDFCDTDLAGIVHFSNYLRYMEAAEVAFLRERGLNVSLDFEGQHLGFPRVSVRCDYETPARFGDVLDIDVTLERLGAKSVTYAFVFTRGGEILARGTMTSVCCVATKGGRLEPIEIPEGIRAKLTAI
ncbi:MAG TPA: thioesterase family protein [Gemmataceae bacterium]|jgi:YbgC/YbaW family acyl-CoA thioester hydrolase|nr:thioesterase family protein [Gemmataceae bacterium]